MSWLVADAEPLTALAVIVKDVALFTVQEIISFPIRTSKPPVWGNIAVSWTLRVPVPVPEADVIIWVSGCLLSLNWTSLNGTRFVVESMSGVLYVFSTCRKFPALNIVG